MAEAEDKDWSEDNKKRMLAALAVLLGYTDVADLGGLSEKELAEVKRKYDEVPALKEAVERKERMPERDIQIKVAEIGGKDGVRLYKIAGEDGDGRQCPRCKEWQGKIVAWQDNPLGYPLVQDFINDGGFHVNCRCSLQELDTGEIPRKAREWLGMNAAAQAPVRSGCYFKIA